jgi:hypothetical protein
VLGPDTGSGRNERASGARFRARGNDIFASLEPTICTDSGFMRGGMQDCVFNHENAVCARRNWRACHDFDSLPGCESAASPDLASPKLADDE